jgi:hypothetical protein
MLHSGNPKGICKWLAAATTAALALTLLPVPGFCQENGSVLHLLIELHRPKKPVKPQPVCLPCTPPGCPMGVCTGAACPWYCPSSCGNPYVVGAQGRMSTATAAAASCPSSCTNCPASCPATCTKCKDTSARCEDLPRVSCTGDEGCERCGACRCRCECEINCAACAAHRATVRRLGEQLSRICAEQQQHIRQLQGLVEQLQGEIQSLRAEKASADAMSAIVKQLQSDIQSLRGDVQTLYNLHQQQIQWPGHNLLPPQFNPPQFNPPVLPNPMPYYPIYYNNQSTPMMPINVVPTMVPETLRTPPTPQVPAAKPATEAPSNWDYSVPFNF